jgi:hypothetical protein
MRLTNCRQRCRLACGTKKVSGFALPTALTAERGRTCRSRTSYPTIAGHHPGPRHASTLRLPSSSAAPTLTGLIARPHGRARSRRTRFCIPLVAVRSVEIGCWKTRCAHRSRVNIGRHASMGLAPIANLAPKLRDGISLKSLRYSDRTLCCLGQFICRLYAIPPPVHLDFLCFHGARIRCSGSGRLAA